MTVDGLVGPETRAALVSAPALVNVVAGEAADRGVATVDSAHSIDASRASRRHLSGRRRSIVEVVLQPDVAMPRCVVMSGQHWLRIVNSGAATHIELGALSLDLDEGATATSPCQSAPMRMSASDRSLWTATAETARRYRSADPMHPSPM